MLFQNKTFSWRSRAFVGRDRRKSFGVAAFATTLLLATHALSAQTIYPTVPGTAASSTYAVTVNGQSVPVELYGTATGNVSFARFALAGAEAQVTVTVSQPVTSYTLSPKNEQIAATVSGNTLSFTLNSPRRLVLRQVNGLAEELFLLADAPEANPPQRGAPGVVDALTQPGIDNQNRAESANGLTAALARLSASGGGTLYVPAGVYNLQHSVRLPSRTTLYLAPGAVLQVAPDYPCCFHDQGVITVEDASDAKLSGRGILNGNAVHLPAANQDFHMIYTENVYNLQIDGLLLLDQGVTGIRLVDAHRSAVRNIEIIANNPTTESDGIDFDSANDILVDNAFIYSSDDNTSQGGGTGVRRTVKDIYNITVQNSVLYNARTGDAFKIGTTDPQNSISNETFSNIDIISAIQVAAFYPTQGADIENITLSNIRADAITDRIWEFQIEVPTWEAWNGRLGYIHNVNVDNVSVGSFGRRNSIFLGYDSGRDINGIDFQNFSIAGQSIRDLSSARIDTTSNVSNIRFSGSAAPAPPPLAASAPLPNGTYIVANRYSSLVLDDPGFSSRSGTPAIQWRENDGPQSEMAFHSEQQRIVFHSEYF